MLSDASGFFEVNVGFVQGGSALATLGRVESPVSVRMPATRAMQRTATIDLRRLTTTPVPRPNALIRGADVKFFVFWFIWAPIGETLGGRPPTPKAPWHSSTRGMRRGPVRNAWRHAERGVLQSNHTDPSGIQMIRPFVIFGIDAATPVSKGGD